MPAMLMWKKGSKNLRRVLLSYTIAGASLAKLKTSLKNYKPNLNKMQKAKNNELGILPSWDLTAFFSGKNDPRIAETIEESKGKADAFGQKWRGKFTAETNASDVYAALAEYEVIVQEAIKPLHYAQLLHSANSTDADNGALVQKTQTAFTEVYNKLLFLELALLALPEEMLQSIAGDAQCANYRHYLHVLMQTRSHRLPEREEHMMADFSLTGNAAFTRFFEEEMSHKKFRVSLSGSEEEWPEEQVLNLLYDADRVKRKAGADALTAGLSEEIRRFTFIFNTLGEDKRIRDRYMRFETPEASRHVTNETTQQQVDTMSSAVLESAGMVSDYYAIKREVLGLEELFDYDRYAPMPGAERIYSFPEAQEIVLDAYGAYSPEMKNRAEEFFDNNWIDAKTRHGKRGGAFCSYGTPDTHPVVFLNYLGTIKHVLTLAHELGHGAHGSLMRRQTLLNFDTPLTIAETASVFGEMLVFDNMRRELSEKEKFSLYAMKIEELFAVIFRQNAMYKFEQAFHAARREEGELSEKRISALWMNTQREMFGSSVTLRDDYRIWWSYIPHFLHTPFYVYAYVYGELLTLSLYEMYKRAADKKAFAATYLEMLAAGGAKTPEELVAPFGVDLNAKEFWQGGLLVVKNMIEELKLML
jgi:oligoendopeptidase F